MTLKRSPSVDKETKTLATKIQRTTAILNALADPATIDAALLTKLGDAYAFTYRRGETLTATQKAGLFIQVTRDEIKRIVQDAIESQDKAAAILVSDSRID